MSSDVKDFLIVLSKGDKVELGDGVIFRIEEQHQDEKRNIMFDLKRCDVNIERTKGNYIIKEVFGVPTFKGQEEIDKVRKVILRQDNVILVGMNIPRVYLAWADTFDELPKGFKEHRKWGSILEMIYDAESKIDSQIQTLKQSSMSEAEVWNQATGSVNKYLENLNESIGQLIETKLMNQGINPPISTQRLPPKSNPMEPQS